MNYSQKLFDDNKKLLYAWFSVLFTRVDILISADSSRDDLVNIAETIKIEMERVEAFANRFDENSELSLINRNAFSNKMVVSAELVAIIDECFQYNKKTLGYFDITVNSINGFKNGAANVLLDPEKQTIKFLHPDVRLDLSGFIKGYVLRAVRNLLQKENSFNTLINVGNSSILALGNHPCGEGWKVSFPDLKTKNECILFDECLTTSGNKEQTKWPILCPHTGHSIEKKQPVSVITDDPATGEVLSIALYVANEDEKELILNQLKGRFLRNET
ncbi:MAG: FAD:protein FMN transferase [Bacteroidia bacterium]|nr:FAD:protein FMN transferase [Bacteroidia bacterium]